MVQHNLDIFKDKLELVADMKICLDHITRLHDLQLQATSTSSLKTQQESLQENVYKIFIKWKEEWRFVLSFVPQFMSTALTTLEAIPKELPQDDVIFVMVLDFLRNLTLCISPKRMVRYWPTEVSWLVKLVGWLELALDKTEDQPTAEAASNWSTLYVLILWLSSAVRTPFDLSRFDLDVSEEETLEHRIDDVIKSTVGNYKLLPVVHLLAGAFYSRPDIVRTSSRLERFICLLLVGLKAESSTVNDKVCCLRALASLLKTVDRTTLQLHVDQIVDTLLPSVDSNHELLTKLAVKILGRCALTRIRPRLLKWRYSCGKRIIDQSSTNAEPILKEIKPAGEEGRLLLDDLGDDEEDFDFDELPPYFESLVQVLLSNLNHASSVVRFSVAKYLASICSRLPYQFSADILGHIVGDLCCETQDDLAWHGACLALAEFVRRGYVRIDFMSRVVEVVEKALFYEHIKGSFSLGTHVRDAAAYICWSMARAYDARLIGTFVDRLAPLLICAACFDRQLNCRRAASAVIQELSGRTQRFPHWIDVIGRTEFQELNLAEHTFLELGVHFAVNYEVFREEILRCLVKEKTAHWDANIRRLAAQTVGAISKSVPFNGSDHLELLLERTLAGDLNARHGAILTLAELVGSDASLKPSAVAVADIWPPIHRLVLELSTRNLFVGIAGDLMREAVANLIEQYCRRTRAEGWNLVASEVRASWTELLLGSISSNENDTVQAATVRATSQLAAVLPEDERATLFKALLAILRRHEQYYPVSTVCRALVLMAADVLEPAAVELTQAIVRFIGVVLGSELRRSETVADAVKTLLYLADRFHVALGPETKSQVAELLVRCLDDHLITNKGNVGLLVRVATMESLSCDDDAGLLGTLDATTIRRIIQLVAAEAIFRRNPSYRLAASKLAMLAGRLISRGDSKVLPQEILTEMVQIRAESLEELELYQRLLKLLRFDLLSYHLWPGLVCVLADPLLETFTKTALNYLTRECTPEQRDTILDSLLNLFADRAKDSRLSMHCLVAIKVLLLRVPTSTNFQRQVAETCWTAVQGTANPKKYLLAADVWCALVPLEDNLRNAFRFLYVLLGHKLPRVRSYTATEMFTALMTVDEDGQLAEAVELLQQTDWLVLHEAKAARDRVRAIVKSVCE